MRMVLLGKSLVWAELVGANAVSAIVAAIADAVVIAVTVVIADARRLAALNRADFNAVSLRGFVFSKPILGEVAPG